MLCVGHDVRVTQVKLSAAPRWCEQNTVFIAALWGISTSRHTPAREAGNIRQLTKRRKCKSM
jgi:hypothetical protein